MDETIIPRFAPAGSVPKRPPIEAELQYPSAGGLRLIARPPGSGQTYVLFAIYPDGTCERWPGLAEFEAHGLVLDKAGGDNRIKERV